MTVSMSTAVIIAVVALVLGLAVGIFAGYLYRKKVAEKEIGSAEDEAKRMINDAIKAAEAKRREAVVEAREEIFKIRTENERECKERRNEVQKQERRIQQKEEALDKKYESIEAKEERLSQKLKQVEEQQEEVAALKRGQLVDQVLTFAGIIGLSIPQFFFGALAILFFALKLHWLPSGGRTTMEMVYWWEHLEYLILPGLVLGITQTASVMRYARASMLESMNKDFVKTARSKGLPEWKVNLKHGFRVSMMPVVVLLGLRVPFLISSCVVIENVFQWPGIGQVFKDAVLMGNYNLVMMIALIMVVMVLIISLFLDIMTRVLDPRVKFN